jgi:cellobiose transport system substrate-binding protein
VKVPRTKRLITAAATAAVAGLVVTGCAAQNAEPDANEPVTLTLSTFGNFGYTDEFLQGFMDEYPNITVEHNIAQDGQAARTNLFTKLAAGSGLADVEAVESSWTVELREYADLFHPVPTDEPNGPWVDIQTAPVTTDDGTLYAYPVGIGPAGICYRADLFEAAGFPSEPDEVAALLEGDWDHYFEVGQDYVDASGGQAWFDSASNVYSGIIGQVTYSYENADGEIVADTNPEVEGAFRQVLDASTTQSANIPQWTDDWYAAIASGGYATMNCPSWMLGLIEGLAPDVTTWRIADVYPGGGGNVGGSWLTVPKQGEHPEEAALLASWLTAPEQQVEVFGIAGTFPSRVNAYDLPELAEISNPYFGGQQTGQIFINRSEAITTFAKQGPNYAQIAAFMSDGLARVEAGTQSIDDAWAQIVQEVEELRG